MSGVVAVAVGVKFLLELGAIVLSARGAYQIAPAGVKWIAAIVVPILLVALWAVLVAPGSPTKLPMPWRATLELVVFGAAAVAGWVAGWHAAVVVFLATTIACELVLLESGS